MSIALGAGQVDPRPSTNPGHQQLNLTGAGVSGLRRAGGVLCERKLPSTERLSGSQDVLRAGAFLEEHSQVGPLQPHDLEDSPALVELPVTGA